MTDRETRERLPAFGEFIRAARQQAGLSMGRVAREIGVSVPYVSDVEHGRRPPFTPRHLTKIAALLRLDADTVMAMAILDRRAAEIQVSDDLGECRVAAGLASEWPHLRQDDIARIGTIIALSRARRRTS